MVIMITEECIHYGAFEGFHDEPQRAAVCPVDYCITDPYNVESEETLLAKKIYMYAE